MNVIHLVSNKVWGGGERYALDLCNALRADGHNVAVYSRPKTVTASVFEKDNLLKGTLYFRGPASIFSPVKLASELNKLEGKSVIHVHNFKDADTALNARRLARNPENIRVVATRHLVKAAKNVPSQLKIYNELDAIVFVSQLALDKFLSTKPAVDLSRLHVIHNSVKLPVFEGQKPGGDTINIIYTGRIAKEKGLDILINSLAMLKGAHWHLTICGTGQGRIVMPIVRAARSLGINDRIDWKGHVDDVIPYLREAHIAVMPSVWQEPFGLAAIEAMSQGCAVVTTDNGAQSEFLTNGETALLVPPADVVSLSNAIGRLIEDSGFRTRLSQNALHRFQSHLSYQTFYNNILSHY